MFIGTHRQQFPFIVYLVPFNDVRVPVAIISIGRRKRAKSNSHRRVKAFKDSRPDGNFILIDANLHNQASKIR